MTSLDSKDLWALLAIEDRLADFSFTDQDFSFLELLVDRTGNGRATFDLGLAYLSDRFGHKDIDKAFLLFDEASGVVLPFSLAAKTSGNSTVASMKLSDDF
jgi:hypothetical protein